MLLKSKVGAFIQAQFLPLGLLLAVVIGLLYPTAGATFGRIPVRACLGIKGAAKCLSLPEAQYCPY
jgi:hypothetical protein